MALLRRALTGMRALFQQKRLEQELDDELRGYLESGIERMMADGMTREAAARAARLEMGSVAAVKDGVRDVGWERSIDALWRDVRYAIRSLRASPGFTAVVLIVLAVGIGGSTAVFSVVDAVVLRGLPFDESDRLVSVTQRDLSTGQPTGPQPPQNYLDWRTAHHVFDGLAAGAFGGGYRLRGDGAVRDIRTRRVTHELFAVLRVRPDLGHTFSAEQEVEGRNHVAVISHEFWRQQFGGDPKIVGQTLALDNGVYEILGVMPAGFTYPIGLPESPQMWVPLVIPANERVRGQNRSAYLQLVGRLKAGVSVAQAEADMDHITAALVAQWPAWFKDRSGVSVRALHDTLVGRVRAWMLLVLGAVVFVLLLACVNVANLLLARAMGRTRELGIRAALGASRWQVARGLLVEGLVLSLTGAALGLFVAWSGAELLRSAMPANVPRLTDIGIDLRVLAVSTGVALATGLFVGFIPAIQFSWTAAAVTLRDGGRSLTAGVAQQRMRTVLVIGEVALAGVLLVGSGLFVSSFARVMTIDLGIDHEHVLTMSVSLGAAPRLTSMTESERKALADRNRQSLEDVLASVRLVPGVERAAILSGAMPLMGGSASTSLQVSADREPDSVEFKLVTPEYHAALGIPLRHGRLFTLDDRQDSAPVVIIDEAAAARYFDGRPALGQTVRIKGDRTIVGIVGNVRQTGPEGSALPEAYVPLPQATSPVISGDLILHTAGTSVTMSAIRRAVLNVLPNAVLAQSRTMEQFLADAVAQRRFNMLLFALFGLLGLVIAMVGIYGVLAYVVQKRTPEFGVRIALGAAPRRILAMVLARATVLIAVGLVAGLSSALALSHLVATFLFNVKPGDSIVYGTVAFVLTLAGLVAALVPALRAARVDPVTAIRAQ